MLGIDQIGIDDDFFELGGDSLLAIRIVSRLQEQLHTDVTIGNLLEAATVAGVVRFMTQDSLLSE